MIATLDSYTAEGRVILTFPESALDPVEREEFIAFAKAEWLARQSQLTEERARELADEIDADWWGRNKERILRQIAEA